MTVCGASDSRSTTSHFVVTVKRFVVAIPDADGSVKLHAMKEWLRLNPDYVPRGLDATASTSHQLRNGLRAAGWTVQSSDSEVRLIRPADASREGLIESVIGSVLAAPTEDEGDEDAQSQSFALEYQLRDFIAQNLAAIEIDRSRLRLYVDPAGKDGIEYPTAVGPIDILAVDESGDFVVFELKRARVADKAVGQLARYMGWVQHTIGRGRAVRGVIVARSIDARLRFAASVIPHVSLYEYEVEFRLTPAWELPHLTEAQ